jgi:NAD-dependent deacetylase
MSVPLDIDPESAATLRRARRWVALTGSGISAESGISTFRGPGGLFEGQRPEDLASPTAFARNPERVWAWYRWRIEQVRAAGPNPAHRALVDLAARVDLTVITQNVDGLHQRAGSRTVLELHGSILRVRCSRPDCVLGHGPVPERVETVGACRCGARIRPDVVWFGEALSARTLDAAAAAIMSCDAALVVGTSGIVYPAAGLQELALEAGACVVEVNPEATPISAKAHVCLRGRAGELLPALIGTLFPAG